jgi:hypothetical protein
MLRKLMLPLVAAFALTACSGFGPDNSYFDEETNKTVVPEAEQPAAEPDGVSN